MSNHPLTRFVFYLILALVLFIPRTQADTKNCIKLKTIYIDEQQLFTLDEQQNLLNPYLGRCIDAKTIKDLITEVDGFYTNNGYITTKPYLKPQDINRGKVVVNVATGTIGDIVNGTTKKPDSKISTAFIKQKNKPLNLRDIETALEMINRVPSVDAKFKIKPSKQPGESIIEVEVNETSPYHFSFGVSGKDDLNDKNPNLNAVFSVDNFLGINDILSIAINGSTLQQEYQSTNGKEINYSFPVGSYLIDLTSADTSYRQGVVGVNQTYLANGDTKSQRLKISKILARDKRNKYQALFSVYHKDTKNYFADQPIEVSSYKTTLAQIDLIHTYLPDWGQWSNTYSYYQGVDWFGARDDSYIGVEPNLVNPATLEFEKFSVVSNLLYYFQDKNYSLNSNFHLQRTKDTLYDNDKLTVGSSNTVRGYDSSNLFGNNAFYIKNDLSKQLKLDVHPKLLKTINPFIGLDYGKVKCENDNINSCGEVAGTAIGFRTTADNLSADFTWSYPLKDFGKDSDKERLFVFNTSWKF